MKKTFYGLILFFLAISVGIILVWQSNFSLFHKAVPEKSKVPQASLDSKQIKEKPKDELSKNSNNNKVGKTEKDSLPVSKKLAPPPGNKIYFGAFPDFGGPEDKVTAQEIEAFNKLTGKRIFWAYFSNNWGKDGVKFPREKVETIASSGSVPYVRMMPRRIFDTAYDKTFSLQKIIDGKFDTELHQYARDVKDYGKMILMDFGVEMNGNWFPWSGAVNGGGVKNKYGDPQKADGPERFVDAYRHIVDIFREEKADNVTWFFHPDIYSNPEVRWNEAQNYYPGDEYVDWVGISAYGPQTPEEDYWDTFPQIMRDAQSWIKEIAQRKPLALLEFGVTDHHPLGKKSDWLAGAFRYILNENSPLQFRAISYWHENWEEDDDLWATLRLDSSPAALAVFRKHIANERFLGGKDKFDQEKNEKLKQCPQEWIVNKMPGVYDSGGRREYFIFNGQRRELTEFDLDWIKANCQVKKQEVW